jgi:hypothetical protein
MAGSTTVRRRVGLAAGAVALLVLAGCGGDEEPGPIGGDEAAPEEGAAPTELDPEGDINGEDGSGDEVDVTVVPDEITEDYVEAVLVELEQIRHDALVEFRENDGEMTIEVMDMTASVFTADEVDYERYDLDEIAADDFEGLLPPGELQPEEPRVEEILAASASCVLVETEVSADGLLVDPPPPGPRIYHLVLQTQELVEDYNVTPWVIAMIPADIEHWRGENPCND